MSERDEGLFERWHWDFLSTTNGKATPELVVKFAIAIRDEALAEAPLYKQGYDAGYCNGLAARNKEIAAVLDAVAEGTRVRTTMMCSYEVQRTHKATIASIRERLQVDTDSTCEK